MVVWFLSYINYHRCCYRDHPADPPNPPKTHRVAFGYRCSHRKATGELHSENQFWELVVAVEAPPTSLRGLDELEDHGECGEVR